MIQALHIDFTDTLRTAHHIRRVHGFVGRNHHKFLDAILHAQVGYHLCTVYIVLHSLRGIVLHHRHVLVSSSMEYIVRLELLENTLHPVGLADARHHRCGLNAGVVLGHH